MRRRLCVLLGVVLAGTWSVADGCRFGEVSRESGFAMDGYFVWCGAVIPDGGAYHLFASRWPVSTKFPEGYRDHSEIVRAVAPRPEGPYVFQEVVIGARKKGCWDSGMAHNPAIYKVGNTFVLYYIGSDVGAHHRRVGLATAKTPAGPWVRSDQPLNLGTEEDANNPSACFAVDGSVKMIWRTADLRVCISTAPTYAGPFTLANSNAWPSAKLEDFFFFRRSDSYHVICEDNVGAVTGHARWGAHLVSPNGVSNWGVAPDAVVYNQRIRWTDGNMFEPRRRERPWMLIENGSCTFLFTAVYDGQRTWNQPVPVKDVPWETE